MAMDEREKRTAAHIGGVVAAILWLAADGAEGERARQVRTWAQIASVGSGLLWLTATNDGESE